MASSIFQNGWLLDSGISTHMELSEKEFMDLELLKSSLQIIVAKRPQSTATRAGTIYIMLNKGVRIKIADL